MTEIGYMLRQEGVREGLREAVLSILLHKFGRLPDTISDEIENQNDEGTLRKWLLIATDCNDLNELNKKLKE